MTGESGGSMNLNRLFDVSVKSLVKSAAALISSGHWCRNLRLLGCSTMTASIPGTKVQSVSIYPSEGENALLALGGVYVDYDKGKQIASERFGVLISAGWKDGKLVIDLSSEAVPRKPTRVYHDHLEVPIGKETFSSAEEVTPGHRKVDGNTLCAYLAGTASAGEVRGKAFAAQHEQSARERVVELERELERYEVEATTAAALLGNRIEKFAGEIDYIGVIADSGLGFGDRKRTLRHILDRVSNRPKTTGP